MTMANSNYIGYTNKPKHLQNALQFSKRSLKSDVAIGLKVLQCDDDKVDLTTF